MRGRITGTGERPRYEVEGREVSKEEFDLTFPDVTTLSRSDPCSLSSTPLSRSEVLGVHPKQREAATEQAKNLGVPTEFDNKGRALITSRAHQKALVKALGMVNYDGGYGD